MRSLFTPATPEEKAKKAQQRAERDRARAAHAAQQAQLRAERMEQMPTFVVRQMREVTVKANDMADAMALANAAFKEGQSSDHSIKWNKPFGVEGDTIDAIRVVGLKAVEEEW